MNHIHFSQVNRHLYEQFYNGIFFSINTGYFPLFIFHIVFVGFRSR